MSGCLSFALRAALLLGLISACSAAKPNVPPPGEATLACEQSIASGDPALTGLFRSDYAYTCRLAEAFRDFVEERRGCDSDDDCVFVDGHCSIPSASINATYLTEVISVRDRVANAYSAIAGCSACGGVGPAPMPRCSRGQCG
jgi:hypothetical protein